MNGWRKVSGVICDRRLPARVKEKVYSSVVRPAMVYELETVAVTKKQVDLENDDTLWPPLTEGKGRKEKKLFQLNFEKRFKFLVKFQLSKYVETALNQCMSLIKQFVQIQLKTLALCLKCFFCLVREMRNVLPQHFFFFMK